MKYVYLIFFIIINFGFAVAQDKDEINIAVEYMLAGETIKAKETYAKLSKKNENIRDIYSNYTSLLATKDDVEVLNKFLKRAIKAYPQNIFYKIDLYLSQKENDKNDKLAIKNFDNLLREMKQTPTWYTSAGAYLINKKYYSEALQVYLDGRNFFGNEYLYLEEVIKIFKYQNREKDIINELVSFLEKNPLEIESVENILQQNIEKEIDFEYLEQVIYKKIQKNSNDIQYNELLYWMYVQKKNFTRALIQAKAIDKRKKTFGNKLVQLGKIALENKRFDDAIKIFQVVIQDYKNGDAYDFALKNIIFSKEELLKSKYPVDRMQVLSLSNEYRKLVTELGGNNRAIEPLRKWAMLQAFYLDNKDTAIVLLNQSIQYSANDAYARDLAKIDLADIYVLNDEAWEAILLYYQVEKTQKEQTLGHEAKLRNAKVSYYKGEFELAKEHLDVLKLATTREISNDAIYLGLLIQDNLIEDSTGTALKSFSRVGLLLFQNKLLLALDSMKQMLNLYPKSTLTDDIYYEQAKVYRKLGNYDSSIVCLKRVIKDYPEEILADDAVLLLAKIYEENLNDTEKAKEAYLQLFTTYSSSIYADEARKKYRLLRGDKI